MAHAWESLKHKASPAQRAKVRAEAHDELESLGFGKLRQARQKTQQTVAEKLGVQQSAVSRMERQQDMLLSTLDDYLRALGGRLEVRAVFPNATFQIDRLASKPVKRAKQQRPAA